MTKHDSMRGWFAYELYQLMKEDKDIFLLTGDLGFGMLDKIQEDFPERFINCGASEQAMLGIAVGLALEGKKPFCYTITSFYLRALETINLYLSHEGIPVFLIGGGRDQDYAHDGYSHDATAAQNALQALNIDQYYPDTKEAVPAMIKLMLKAKKPAFISLRR